MLGFDRLERLLLVGMASVKPPSLDVEGAALDEDDEGVGVRTPGRLSLGMPGFLGALGGMMEKDGGAPPLCDDMLRMPVADAGSWKNGREGERVRDGCEANRGRSDRPGSKIVNVSLLHLSLASITSLNTAT